MIHRTSFEDIARRSWGKPTPPWVVALSVACDVRGVDTVATQLDLSEGTVLTILNRTIHINEFVANETEFRILACGVMCPVVGFLRRQHCLCIQANPETTAYPSSIRRAFVDQCPTCPHSRPHGRRK